MSYSKKKNIKISATSWYEKFELYILHQKIKIILGISLKKHGKITKNLAIK